jgi:hypothetical protein
MPSEPIIKQNLFVGSLAIGISFFVGVVLFLGNSLNTAIYSTSARAAEVQVTPPACVSDINHDEIVDVTDLSILKSEMNRNCTTQDLFCADITGRTGQPDGIVDFLDYQFLQSHMNIVCFINP